MIGLADEAAAQAVPRLVARFGPQARDWCARLPAVVAALADEWRLELTGLAPAGSNSVVLTCVAGRAQRAVLKLTPDCQIAADEATALTVWADSPFVVDLFESDPLRGAVLLEQVLPGSQLGADGWALGDVMPMLADLRQPRGAQPSLPALRERVDFVFDLTLRRRPQAVELVERSRGAALAQAVDGPVGVAHGDLHPGNVLGGSAGPIAIDPRPCWGDQASDLIDWVLVGAEDESTVERRIAELVDALPGVDADRLWRWCRSMAVVVAASILNRRPDDRGGEFLLSLAGSRSGA